MPLNNAQLAVAKSPARFRVFVAGRRTGKTFLSVRELARFARHPNRRILYICPTYQMGRDIIWTDLKQRLGDLNWIAKTNESRLELTLVNNTIIAIRSGDNPDSLRGGGYDFVVFDETSDLKPEIWYEVIRPALSAQKPPGQALFCGTPKGVNWFQDLYLLGKNEDPAWASFQFTTLEGGNVPEEEILAAKSDLDERTFRAEYEASFETFSGVCAYNFTDDHIVKWKQDSDYKQILIGVDMNVDPMSSAIMVRTEHGLHVIDEISMFGSNTDELAQEIKNRYSGKSIIVFPDPAGVQRKTSANGRTDISILQNAGFTVKHRPRHPAVKDRLNALNSLLLNSNGDKRLLVDPKCKETIKCLKRHVYKEGTQVPDKSTGYDHQVDALSYAVEYLFPVTKQYQPDPTKSWGVY
jgi:hypothetical protein